MLLVVEDDTLVRLTLVDGLEEEGFSVLEAEDADAALALLHGRRDIDAMLTDINLPGGRDGFELAVAARALRPDLPIVYASGRYGGADPARSVAGARFLAKPFAPANAGITLRGLLAAPVGGSGRH